jgi:hypothetical protein
VLVLGATLLLNLRDGSQSSCLVVVRARRVLLLLAMWSAACALLVLSGAPSVGRVLLVFGGAAAVGAISIGVCAFACARRREDDGTASAGVGEALICDAAGGRANDEAPEALLVPDPHFYASARDAGSGQSRPS